MPTRDTCSRSTMAEQISDSNFYTQSNDSNDLLDFVVKLRNFAPFNAMLLQIQKSGLSHAAFATDSWQRFRRNPNERARHLFMLQPFGTASLVKNVADTEGKESPDSEECIPAADAISRDRLETFKPILQDYHIEWLEVDEGDKRSGSIRVIQRALDTSAHTAYRMHINRNHPPAIQFATLVHELAHLLLGHLGEDKNFRAPPRTGLSRPQVELEAESVSYLVCARNGIESKSEIYLSHYVGHHMTIYDIDIYLVLRAAQDIEKLLNLSPSSSTTVC